MVKLTVRDNGPIRVEGEFELVDQEGRPWGLAGRTKISLCRCDLSKNRPFCDGAHKGTFESCCEATELPPPPPPKI